MSSTLSFALTPNFRFQPKEGNEPTNEMLNGKQKEKKNKRKKERKVCTEYLNVLFQSLKMRISMSCRRRPRMEKKKESIN